jgi:hypothetical protein
LQARNESAEGKDLDTVKVKVLFNNSMVQHSPRKVMPSLVTQKNFTSNHVLENMSPDYYTLSSVRTIYRLCQKVIDVCCILSRIIYRLRVR